jgi:hypothetical protein
MPAQPASNPSAPPPDFGSGGAGGLGGAGGAGGLGGAAAFGGIDVVPGASATLTHVRMAADTATPGAVGVAGPAGDAGPTGPAGGGSDVASAVAARVSARPAASRPAGAYLLVVDRVLADLGGGWSADPSDDVAVADAGSGIPDVAIGTLSLIDFSIKHDKGGGIPGPVTGV